MAGLLYRIGRFAAKRHWVVIISWIVILAICGVTYSLFHGTVATSISIPDTPTTKVQDQLKEKLPAAKGGSGTLIFETKNGEKFTDAQKSDIQKFLGDIKDIDGVKTTQDPFANQEKIEQQKQQLADGEKQIADGRSQLDAQKTQLDQGRTQLEQAQAQLDAKKQQAQAAGAQGASALAQLQQAQAQLDAKKQQLDDGQKKLDDANSQLTTNEKKLKDGSELLSLSKNMRFVSSDGTAAIGTVQFNKNTIDVPQGTKADIASKAEHAGIDGVNVYASNELAQTVPSVFGVGEAIGVVVAGIVLLIMLGTIIGAVLPLVSAIFGVGVAVLAATSFSSLVEFISVTPILGIMLGLAVGIDYSLFILNRHRKQLKQGMAVHESIGLANGTSGNAVVFAGSTVIVALLALNITGIPFLGLMGTVGAGSVLVAILIATTFTPALLSIFGMRLLKRKERKAAGHPDAHRETDKPGRKSVAALTLVAGVVVLGIIALPAMYMRLGLPDGSSESTSSSQYKAYKVVEKKFGAGQNGPLLVTANLDKKISQDDVTANEASIGRKIMDEKNVSAVAPVAAAKNGSMIAFQVIPKTGPNDEGTANLVTDLRKKTVTDGDQKVTFGVAGNASATIDISKKLADVLPIYLVVVVGLSILILILVFRSILVPITATLGFVLSLLAAFGGLTAIFQLGWFASLFGVHDPGPILSFLPIIEVGILFGLAMDYQLFLVSGMREAFVHGAEAGVAVKRGLYAGRAVVTAAAIIMASVFAGFIFSESTMIRPIGFGLAFGVLADAFIVRMLLIPAAMTLLGKSAWWIPRWLDRILPNVDVEGAALERAHPATGANPAVESDSSDGNSAARASGAHSVDR